MKIAVPPRHRRLLGLCACSAALHLALLDLLARHGAGMPLAAAPAAVPATDPLLLRLVPPATSPATGTTAPATATATVATPARPRAVPAGEGGARQDKAAAAAAPEPEAGTGLPMDGTPAPPAPVLPGRYRVRMPPPVLLDYAQALRRPGAAPVDAGRARIDWRTDGQHYRLRADGVLGSLSSEGERGDAGILPRSASEERDGARQVTRFDHEGGQVRFDGAADAPAVLGIQDRASLLMQLTGMGLASADQIDGTIDLVVAGAREATLVRFRVAGLEDVETGIGTLQAWHLAEVAAAGRPRLDLWLAPALGWLPVRLSVARPDGSVADQVLDAAPGEPPALAP